MTLTTKELEEKMRIINIEIKDVKETIRHLKLNIISPLEERLNNVVAKILERIDGLENGKKRN